MKILFVCEYNACRSQMAEGLARELLPKDFSVYSAGLHPGRLNSTTVEVMREIDIDISRQYSKRLSEMAGISFDLLVVLAEPAWEAAQAAPAQKRLLWHFPDPVALPGEPEELKQRIRIVRDDLKNRIRQFNRKHE